MMDDLVVIREGDINIVFDRSNGMFNIQSVSDQLEYKNALSSIVKNSLNGAMYVTRIISDSVWGDIVAFTMLARKINKTLVKKVLIKSIRLWVDVCGICCDNDVRITDDPIYGSFLFRNYMSIANDNIHLKRFVRCLREKMLVYDLPSLCLYLSLSISIDSGIILTEKDLLDALIN